LIGQKERGSDEAMQNCLHFTISRVRCQPVAKHNH
jgi:hypothetical protein